ncbi:serine/threonine-protein kinase [Streptomyces xanthophaeus]|uniref:serine/threonine-protein kinase n=1 Tax=Streptomyces xanthophaeus TaxID=67385 RepID=UPI0026485B42|nr:serine/threonine-protein kinase [Streptomyces xanthophaeus]WKD31131.1 serine/threonine protein kinase [Streptomyces xanthophaeus]
MNVAGMHIGGRYRLEALLGRGGMGEVWRAHDPRLDRKVAIKFLPPHLADGHVVDRFLREAQVTARLQHAGITQVFDSGAQDGQLHLVMELLDGRNLGTVLQEQTSGLPVHRAVDLAAQVADALSYAHRADIVHRDIKPANLMLVAGGRVKVCDFGIAGFVQADSGLTREGSLMGTPDYMAPEQCQGRRVDGRADLYALGCVLFALLTGKPPFTTHGDFRVVMMDHIHTPPPRPASLRPGVPVELDRFVSVLLSKDPGDRPEYAGAVADRLRNLISRRTGAPLSVPRQAPTPASPCGPDPRYAYAGRPAPAPPASGFTMEADYGDFLHPEATEVHTVVTVTGAGAAPDDTAAAAPRALVFLLGLSERLPAADFRTVTAAVAAAVDGLDEGAAFAVVAGSDHARMLYPDTMRLVRANAETKAEARAALAGLEPVGAVAFGRWLRLADRLLAAHGDAVRTAILLMDATVTAESPEELPSVLASCAGRFTCHARGIGTDWEVAAIRSITTALSGTLDIVMDPSEPTSQLTGELTALIARTRQSFARDLALRVAMPGGGQVRFVKQLTPSVDDLTGHGYQVGPGTGEYPIEVPDGESRDYHLLLDLPPGSHDGEAVAAELSIVALPPSGDGQTLARLPIPVRRDAEPPSPS